MVKCNCKENKEQCLTEQADNSHNDCGTQTPLTCTILPISRVTIKTAARVATVCVRTLGVRVALIINYTFINI